MKLIKIETKGFKSFAEKVTLSFDGGVVGIVGPNGSGKSNINDAIKWVLGERSIKSLRGATSDDIIFAGSKAAPASNKAEVSLTFDNSEQKVSIPHKIFTITRVLNRGSGENEYYINNEVAKLKDIEEIAMESGISKSSLAIISQGTIQNIAQASPEERRGIFEEAAGVSKYKSKKEEALRKLERTSEALDKVKAVVSELEKQLNPLRRQADKARLFLAKKEELKDVEIGLIVEDVQFFEGKLAELNATLKDVIEEKTNITSKISQAENNLEDKVVIKLKLENEVMKLSQQFQDVTEKLNNLEIASSQASQRRQMIIDGQIKASDEARLSALKEELEELSKKASQYEVWNGKLVSDVESNRADIAARQTELAEHNVEIDRVRRELMQIKTKIALLEDHENNKSHLFKGTKIVLENKNMFPGVLGIVSDLIKVEETYIPAIETVLSTTLQHIVVDKSDTAVKAINFLKQNRAGRSTFIPLDTIKPRGIAAEHFSILQGQKGFVGMASDLVQSAVKFEILKKFLLGNIIIAETVEHSESIARLMRNQYMVVSLEGDIIRAGGVMTGGEKNRTQSSLLGGPEQIVKLSKEIPQLESILGQKLQVATKLTNEIAERQLIISELNIEMAKVREKSFLVEGQFNSAKAQYDAEAKEKFTAKAIDLVSTDVLESEKASISAILKAKRDSIVILNHELATLNIEKTEYEKTLRHIVETSSTKMTEKNQAEYILNSQTTRLAEEYSMTPEAAAESFSLKMNYDEAKEIVTRLRQEIRDLGHVNLESIEAFEEVNARHEKLKSSEEELFNAKQTILAAIGEMDQIIITRLDDTVKKVNEAMNVIFQKLFGGGHAEVRYTNPANLLETGIDVIAQPPGKTVKNLNLFSGGEKAMVAISLLFAILKSKPLPLCILDEVEAALDDANVIRFATYLQELKAQTQFLVITHRVGTMSRVDHLFGATMQTKGITSFFTVKLADAQKLLDN